MEGLFNIQVLVTIDILWLLLIYMEILYIFPDSCLCVFLSGIYYQRQ